MTVAKFYETSAGTVSYQHAGSRLEITCGAASIVLTDGQVFVKGDAIHLVGGGALNGDAAKIQWNCGASEQAPERPAKEADPEQTPTK